MKENDMLREIEQLKQQLDALSAAKAQASAQESPEGPEAPPQSSGGGEAASWVRDLLKQAEELIGALDLQFKDVPARTALVIFALGILTGRLLARRG